MGERVRPRDGADNQRTLRLLVLAPASLLLLTIGVFSIVAGRFNDSISAYYGGPARDVFVGCLVATSLGLLAYRGRSDLEDLALNGAGFYAPFVAFVPYDFARSASSVRTETGVDAAGSLKVILVCYLVAALVFAIVDYFKGTWAAGRLWRGSLWTRVMVTTALVGLSGHVLLVIARLLERDTRFAGVHLSAAVLMIVSLGIAVASHVIPASHRRRLCAEADVPAARVRALYRVIVVGMALGGPALWVGLAWAGVSSAVFWTEALEVALFLVFWVSEVARFWSAPVDGTDRPSPTLLPDA